MGSRIVRVAVAVLVAAGWALAGGAVGQAAEGEDDRAYLERTCRRVIDMHPTDDLDKETDPDPGSKVAPGDVIKVKLTWDRDWWEGNDLHKVLDCVTVDGELDLDLSSEEKPTDNDGVYETEIPVPDDASDGTEICNIGFVSGEGPEDDFEQKPSDEICFEVERDNPPHEDAAPPPGDRDDSPPPGDRDDSPPPGDRDDSPPPPLVEEPEVAAPPVTQPPAPEVTAPPSGPPKV
ncbi:MAG: hypothetical protein ACRDY7_17540, partial [Acidimicrobiia bacterium]